MKSRLQQALRKVPIINVKETKIPHFANLPIDSEHLQENGLLFSDEKIMEVKEYFKTHPNVDRLSHEGREADYSVIKLNGELFIVYLGKRAERELGEGGNAKVKLIQKMEGEYAGEWYAMKVIPNAI